ncbi:hypothetical protein SDC9_142928 [bioreactor metagenome]|uniref:Uncharacterized protein n=1 Tax=bioreactor metagenome TaxID=1076179 RepID=A0A645E4P8_9ZZZZ
MSIKYLEAFKAYCTKEREEFTFEGLKRFYRRSKQTIR